MLAVVDSRGRVHNWRTLKGYTQFWRDPLAIVSRATPAAYIEEVRRAGCDALVAGDQRVDLRAALELLAAEHGVTRVRVDSGGALAGALLADGLVHEVSLMVYPLLAGGAEEHTFNRLVASDGALGPAASPALSLVGVDQLDGGVARLRYEVAATV
jgi:2,5-diamino-6-(ribosylamino)-4(3H)-pyrimidinone 5'-phosphate reductase